jgi:pimeloyl-ACP methyl ester carboxylesterase
MRQLGGLDLEVAEYGTGKPLLFLHSWRGDDVASQALETLAGQMRVIAPSHPGFGRSDLRSDLTTVGDLADYYIDLLDELGLDDVAVVGASFGAWVALEMAVRSTPRISHLVVADAFGVKIGGREDRDIADIFAVSQDDLIALSYADPAPYAWRPKERSEADLLAYTRSREAAAHFGWLPYMHNPKLKQRLKAVRVPTLFLWGAQDRIVSPDYGRAFAALVPDAEFELIERAGHFPHVEQPEAFGVRVTEFLGRHRTAAH